MVGYPGHQLVSVPALLWIVPPGADLLPVFAAFARATAAEGLEDVGLGSCAGGARRDFGRAYIHFLTR